MIIRTCLRSLWWKNVRVHFTHNKLFLYTYMIEFINLRNLSKLYPTSNHPIKFNRAHEIEIMNYYSSYFSIHRVFCDNRLPSKSEILLFLSPRELCVIHGEIHARRGCI